jgi:antitoxin (DNA-binding transcriptional repressor) of toxin-antitoxin stability system
MRVIDIQDAQANLELLIDDLKPGEWFLISVEDRPRVKVMALTEDEFEQLGKDEVDATSNSAISI